jgi:hypothetical protein
MSTDPATLRDQLVGRIEENSLGMPASGMRLIVNIKAVLQGANTRRTCLNAEAGPGCRIEKYPKMHTTLFKSTFSGSNVQTYDIYSLVVRSKLTAYYTQLRRITHTKRGNTIQKCVRK